MWQTDWAEQIDRSSDVFPNPPGLSPAEVDCVYALYWTEHCIECAVPRCYQTCPLYVSRRDRKCARFKRGIVPNRSFPGLFPYGAEIQFRRWGKLEAQLGCGTFTPGVIRLVDGLDRICSSAVRALSSTIKHVNSYYRLSGAYAVAREYVLRTMARKPAVQFDEFVLAAENKGPAAIRMILECSQKTLKFRTSILMPPGATLHRIPAAAMNVDLSQPGFIRVYPGEDAEAHIVFSWLDFVRYSRTGRAASAGPLATSTAKPAPKVKCVVWDLDNTLWDGILGEGGAEGVSLRDQAVATMLALDERGVLQSIASKNDHDEAWRALQHFGLSHLFLHPAIGWQAKSAGIRTIARQLNISTDSLALIDDSAFERAEVTTHVPEVRTYSDADIPALLQRGEFDVPVTDEARRRRLSYVAESERQQRALAYAGDYRSFLRTCELQAELFTPASPEQRERCLELLQRSNQLNLSSRRYTRDQFNNVLHDPNAFCLATSCRDRFGDYGLVGFAVLRTERERLLLTDFVLSCRVAQKRVENAWLNEISKLARAAGYSTLCATYVKTSRNHVLLEALVEAGFTRRNEAQSGSLLQFDCHCVPADADVVAASTSALVQLPPAAVTMTA